MSKHTPGPFVPTVVDHGPNGLEYIIRQECQSGDGIIIAQNVNREDRYLLAAAPELLDEVETLIDVIEKGTESPEDQELIIEHSKRVLAKARGKK